MGSPDSIVDDEQVNGQESQPGALPGVRHYAMPRMTKAVLTLYSSFSPAQRSFTSGQDNIRLSVKWGVRAMHVRPYALSKA